MLPTGLYTAKADHLTVTLANGATIWFKSAEKPDNLYGEDVYAAVMDEATRIREEAWHAPLGEDRARGGRRQRHLAQGSHESDMVLVGI